MTEFYCLLATLFHSRLATWGDSGDRPDEILAAQLCEAMIVRFPARHGGTPIAGWFLFGKIPSRMDDDMGYPYDSGNLHVVLL